MTYRTLKRVALCLGSAALLFSCKEDKEAEKLDPETLVTMHSENLTMIYSVNGRLSYRFETPLLERYELAAEPYMEFTKGVKVETYNDSTRRVESELIADYAKYIEPLELWEARGNVVAKNDKGQVLETEQLFWNQKTDRIYSNVDSKITQGSDVIRGIGFESNSKFDDFVFRRPKGQVTVETEPLSPEEQDSVGRETDRDTLMREEPPAPRSENGNPPATRSAVPASFHSARPEPERPVQPVSRQRRNGNGAGLIQEKSPGEGEAAPVAFRRAPDQR